MENQATPIRRMRRTVTMLLSWLLFGVCLMVVLGEIFGFHAPALAHQEPQPQPTTAHHHSGILDLQAIWNEMEGYYDAP